MRTHWLPALAILGGLVVVGIGVHCGGGGSTPPIKSEGGGSTPSSSDAAVRDAAAAADTGTATGGGGTGTFINPAPGGRMFIGANFWNVDWEGADNYFVAGTNFATTTNPWKAQLLTDVAPYGVIRFMDWNQTNFSNNPQAHWATRKQKTADQSSEPIAYEWQIDLCNRTGKDYWVNISHESTPDDWKALADFIKANLDPSLRVYVEWSNEVWNNVFPQAGYSAQKANDLGLPGSNPAEVYHVYESVRVFETFESVFGKNSPRLVKVISGQAASTYPCESQITALANTTINPNGTRPSAYAIAPYLSGTSIDSFGGSLPEVLSWVTDSATCAKKMGVPLIAYEGGADSYAAGGGCTQLQVDPGMHDVYVTYLNGIATAGLTGPFVQYTHSGRCWGLKLHTDDPISNAPKYKAVLDFLVSHGP